MDRNTNSSQMRTIQRSVPAYRSRNESFRPARSSGGRSSRFGGGSGGRFGGGRRPSRGKGMGDHIDPNRFINKAVITEKVEHFIPEHNFADFLIDERLKANIISKGMIYSPSYGDTAFTVPKFDEYMRRVMPDFSPRPHNKRKK